MLGVDSYKINRESSRKATASLPELEVHHKRPVGLRYNKGLLHGLCVKTNAIKEADSAHIQSGSIDVDPTGSRKVDKQGCGLKSTNASGRVLLKPVPGPEEGWRIKTSDQSESSKSACADTTLQDGGHPYLEGSNTAQRLACKSRFEGCILFDSDSSRTQEVSTVCIPRANIRIQLPSLWPLVSSMGLYQDPQTCISYFKRIRSPYDRLHRRYPFAGGVQAVTGGPCSRTGLFTRMSGVYNKQGEVTPTTNTVARIFGNYGRYTGNGAKITGRENEKDSCRGRQTSSRRIHFSKISFSPVGQDECYFTGYTPCSSILSSLANATYQYIRVLPSRLRGTGGAISRLHRRTELVDYQYEQMEWEDHNEKRNRHDNRVRCILGRMGSSVLSSTDRRSMVTDRANDAYQLPGVVSSNSSGTNIYKEPDQDISFTSSGQYHSSGLYQQLGRDSVPGVGIVSKESLDVVPGEEYPHYCSTPSWRVERSCRLGKSNNDGPLRLEAESCNLSEDRSVIRSTGSGFVCIQADSSDSAVLQLETRPTGSGNRCISSGLDNKEGFCKSPLVLDRSNTVTCSNPISSDCIGSTCLESPAMVSSPSGDDNGLSQVDTRQSSSTRSTPVKAAASTSRMAYLRERYTSEHLSEEATSLMLKSWRSKTNKSYDSLFGRWNSWCCKRGTDPISGPVTDVLNFLADLHKQGYKYRSLNSYRSAISSVHEKVDGHSVGEHPMVSRLMKGVFNDRPPLPKYTSTWKVETVLNYLESLGDNDKLSLTQLTWKTVMLLALTRPSRSADLSQLDIRMHHYSPEGVTFTPGSLAKQSRQGKSIREFFFPSFPSNITICPITTLKAYERRTECIRSGVSKLFIATIKPHRAVSSSTIARWLRRLLEVAGVDTSIFTAHSVRGASSSKASNMGISTNDILTAADWSSESVFNKFYYKSTQDPSFGRAVLGSHECKKSSSQRHS